MHRFFSPLKNISGNKIIINDQEKVHHIKDVLRLKAGDEVIVFDGQGSEYHCVIEKVSSRQITLAIKHKSKPICKRTPKITIACAIPKKSKLDDIIDKLTQIGVERIIPLITQRVIVKLDKHKAALRQKRWQKVAESAAQQSQRQTLPLIDAVKEIKEVLSESAGFDLKLIPTLLGSSKSLKEVFANFKPKNILVLIGPEGDFTDEEVNLSRKYGFIPVTLGDAVLRVETAAIAVASFIKLYADS